MERIYGIREAFWNGFSAGFNLACLLMFIIVVTLGLLGVFG